MGANIIIGGLLMALTGYLIGIAPPGEGYAPIILPAAGGVWMLAEAWSSAKHQIAKLKDPARYPD